MKKLLIISALFFVVISTSITIAGDIYWNSDASFYNQSTKLRKATGTASVSYSYISDEWTITLAFSGLLKNKAYIFQIGVQDQLEQRYDINVTSNKSGNINETITIGDLDTHSDADILTGIENISYPPYDTNPEHPSYGYTIFRLLDLSGTSGGLKLTNCEPNGEEPDGNPYYPSYPKATMVMRAREDGALGSLTFSQPLP